MLERFQSARYWFECIQYAMKWIEQETAICRRVLRLRCHLYLKVAWIETNDLVNYLLKEDEVCLVPSDKRWLTRSSYLNSDGDFKTDYEDEFLMKQSLYNEWVGRSRQLGGYAENLVKKAFVNEGYSAQNATYQFSNLLSGNEVVQIDADCVKPGWHFGVQVKNAISEVFIDPSKIKEQTGIYKRLVREFELCSQHNIIPVLIAPFIDSSFYCFDDKHKGLHCQTLIQYFAPEDEVLCKKIREILKFGNLKAVTELPPNVTNWIYRMPEMWNKRHAFMIERPA